MNRGGGTMGAKAGTEGTSMRPRRMKLLFQRIDDRKKGIDL